MWIKIEYDGGLWGLSQISLGNLKKKQAIIYSQNEYLAHFVLLQFNFAINMIQGEPYA